MKNKIGFKRPTGRKAPLKTSQKQESGQRIRLGPAIKDSGIEHREKISQLYRRYLTWEKTQKISAFQALPNGLRP